jgi:uncharacterized protein YceH (UPF0502 family)
MIDALQLSALEARILGCLIEKEITLPDYYPLTLNALSSACNQTTNRDPIMSLDDSTVLRVVEGMKTRGWIFQVSIVGARVQKYRHNLNARIPGLEKPSRCFVSCSCAEPRPWANCASAPSACTPFRIWKVSRQA